MPALLSSQNSDQTVYKEQKLLFVESNPNKGFNNGYFLFIPKGTPKNKSLYLLVEPNNTGRLSDSIEVHMENARRMASESSIGNNISTELKIPLLVPVFPRPKSKPLVYTHALDRDVILEESEDLKRLDLQLIAMVNHSKELLADNEVLVTNRIFMNGFSASGTFVNRFLFIHPEIVAAAATGGLNGSLMLPQEKLEGENLNYPLGLNDFSEIFDKEFNKEVYLEVPQLIYMGALDENDAVQFDDAYNAEERRIINSLIGNNVSDRWQKMQEIYRENNVSATLKTWPEVGHWTTSTMNLEVIMFFYHQSKKGF